MDTRQLEYMLAIAEERSLSRAAERLFLSQSALSQRLAKLKAEGLPPLFYRHKGEMLLTDAGKIYINGARIILKICKDGDAALCDIGSNRLHRLRLSISRRLQPLFYMQMLPWLKRDYPDMEVSINTSEAGRMRRALEDGELDLAVFSAMRNSNEVMDYTVLRQEELVLAVPPQAQEMTLPLILPTKGSHLRLLCDKAFGDIGYRYSIYTELDDTVTCLSLVQQGNCAAVLPRTELLDTALAVKSFSPPIIFYTVAACRRGNQSPFLNEILQRAQTLFAAE